MNFRDKIISWDDLPAWRKNFRASGKKLVVTNGCFDILHLGHVTALESVSAVCIFLEKTATKFLAAAQPDIYVKGGDYTLDTLNQDERRAVESSGGKIILVPFVPGKSTTSLLEKISQL